MLKLVHDSLFLDIKYPLKFFGFVCALVFLIPKSEMTLFTKIEDGVIKGVPQDANLEGLTNNHKAVWWRNQVWYFGTKSILNPSREGSAANNEAFQGGYLAIHQMPGWKFTQYPQILDYNYAQDMVFPIDDQIFMFIYSRFDGFYFYGLYYFDESAKQWKDATMQKHGDYAMNRDVDCNVVMCSAPDKRSAYMVVLGQTTDTLKVYEFKRDPQWDNYVDMNTVLKVDSATGYMNAYLLAACMKNQTIFALIGTAKPGGAITSWDQTQVLAIDIQSQQVQVRNTQGFNSSSFPPYPAGASSVAYDGRSRLFVMGGMINEDAYSRDVWWLDLDLMQWQKSCHPIPDDLDPSEMVSTTNDQGIMFMADHSNGIYTTDLKIYN